MRSKISRAGATEVISFLAERRASSMKHGVGARAHGGGAPLAGDRADIAEEVALAAGDHARRRVGLTMVAAARSRPCR